jgi:predicted metal-dependent enzyme (double-stranded beta helix superfamily)
MTMSMPVPASAGRVLSGAQLAGLLREAAAGDWPALVHYDSATRWYRRLARDSDYEIWLLSWLPGQRTNFHDHGGSAGGFTVVRGELRERTVSGTGRAAAAVLATGGVRTFGPRHVHDVENAATIPAVSIHAYSPPLAEMRRYRLGPAGLVLTAVETAGANW